MRSNRLAKLLAVLAVLICTFGFGVPSTQAIEQCQVPCFMAYEQCIGNCLHSHGGTACTNQCYAQYLNCISHIVCQPPGGPLR